MAEWMSGAMIVDKMAMEIIMGSMQALNNPAGMSGITMTSVPTGLNAAMQAEATAPAEKTGAIVFDWTAVFGDGDLYPI